MICLSKLIVLNPVSYRFNERTFLYLSNSFSGLKFPIPFHVDKWYIKKKAVLPTFTTAYDTDHKHLCLSAGLCFRSCQSPLFCHRGLLMRKWGVTSGKIAESRKKRAGAIPIKLFTPWDKLTNLFWSLITCFD